MISIKETLPLFGEKVLSNNKKRKKNISQQEGEETDFVQLFLDYFENCPIKYKSQTLSIMHFFLSRTKNSVESHKWISLFFKLLWQLKSHKPSASFQILSSSFNFLRTLNLSDNYNASFFNQLILIYTPFFFASFKKGNTTKSVFGPFIYLPQHVQSLSLQVLYYLTSNGSILLPSQTLEALINVTPFLPCNVSTQLVDVVVKIYSSKMRSYDQQSSLTTISSLSEFLLSVANSFQKPPLLTGLNNQDQVDKKATILYIKEKLEKINYLF